MDADELTSMLEQYGEVMVAVSDFEEPLELHLHDATIDDQTVQLELTDGILTFDLDEISGAWQHTHSLADFGLE